MTISEALLPEFDQEMENTRKLLECVPEDKFGWKPHEKSMSLGRLASHTAEIPSYAVATINLPLLELTAGQKPFLAGSKSELLAAFDKNVAEARKAIESVSDENLGHNWKLVYGGQTIFDMPRSAVLRSMVMSHLIHHRGQLGVYLRLNEVAIPGMYGPSADTQASFAAA